MEIESKKKGVKYDYRIFVLNMEREKLYDRINKRVDIMIENGLEEEVRKLIEKYTKFPTAMQGLGYKEIIEYFDNKITRDEAIEKIKMESRRYAKRQITWFKSYKNAIWLDAENENNVDIILEEL